MDKWLKYMVGISAIIIAGCAAFFSITGLGILFAGASISVMVMAGTLEYAKLVTATYLKQKWNILKGFNKWYLTAAVIILMAITSAGIFGYLSNAFQQQNIKLDQVAREIQVWQNKIEYSNQQILTLQNQSKDLTSTQNTLITKGNVNNRLLRSVDNRDKQSTAISKKINILQDSIVAYNGHINDIKNTNIDIEREVGGFRFVAEAFGMSLNGVVKLFIFLIVIVFDPLAIALVIAFNQLVMAKKEDEEIPSNPEDLKNFVDESARLRLTEDDLKKLEETLLSPPPPNENLMKAAEEYKRRGELLDEIMNNDQELGLYDESFDNPIIKKDNLDLKEIVEKLQDKEELFPESNQRAKEIIENSNWDVTLMDGLDEQPTMEEEQQNFSTMEPSNENTPQEDYPYQFQDWENETVPEPFITEEEVKLIQEEEVTTVSSKKLATIEQHKKNGYKVNQPTDTFIIEDNERMDIIGQNGNEGLHYDETSDTTDEKKN